MKIIATLTPDEVKPAVAPRYRVRCLEPLCYLACPMMELNASDSFEYVQSYAQSHVAVVRHAVVIESREDVVIHEFHGRTSR